jgi:polysaccharide export outer membrane protein
MRSTKRVVVGCAAYALAALSASPLADAQSHETLRTSQITDARAHANETLGEGDVVRISVFQNPDLTTEARISDRGAINFPLIGEVAIGGLTPADAEARIAQQLSRGKFVVRPQVNLTVVEVRSRQVAVLGQVGKPGRYPLDGVSDRLTDVLALAGGITPGGDDNVVVMINRNGKASRTLIDVPAMYRTGDMSRNVRLENGDVIYVERAPQFYVSGEVQRAGAYRLEPDMTVMQAVSVGGGLTARGTLRGLEIQRRMPDGQIHELSPVRLTDLVEPNDVILVRERLF